MSNQGKVWRSPNVRPWPKAWHWPRIKCGVKCLITIGFAACILVVGIGGFFLGAVFSRPIGGGAERATAVVEEAKRRVPAPNLPPKPAGHTTTETKQVPVELPLPFGGATRIMLPATTSKLVGATPEETAKWEAETAKSEQEYEQKLTAEAKKIANEMFVNDWRSAVVLFKAYSKEVILPFLAALAGIVGAIATLMKAFRTKPSASE